MHSSSPAPMQPLVQKDWTNLALHPGCKINLSIRITGTRPDGYHLLDSVFLALDKPCDTMHLAPAQSGGLTVSCTEEGIDCQKNSLTKAWALFAEKTGFAPNLHCELVKGIPWGAGLGGGTSDAAALLSFLQAQAKANGISVAPKELMDIGAKVGADVPFFLSKTKCCRVQGIGEILEELAPGAIQLPGEYIVLAMPRTRVSTPWAYKAYDDLLRDEKKGAEGAEKAQNAHPERSSRQLSPSPDKTLTDQKRADKENVPQHRTVELFLNDLEVPVFREYPELGKIKDTLLQLGACVASMSGSGSCIFGIFAEYSKARAVADVLDCPVQICHLTGM